MATPAAPAARGAARLPPPAAGTGTLRPGAVWLFEGRGFALSRLACDLVALVAATWIADRLDPGSGGPALYLFAPAVMGLFALLRLYDASAQLDGLDRAARVAGGVALGAVLVSGVLVLVDAGAADHALLFAELVAGVALVLPPRLALGAARRRARVRGLSGRPTLIAGAGEVGARLERRLEQLPELGLVPVGFLDPDPPARKLPLPVLGSLDDLDEAVARTGARHLLIAFMLEPDRGLRRIVRRCEELGLEVSLVPRLFDETTDRIVLEHVGGVPVFALRHVDPKGWQFAIKHALDRVGAALALVVLAPLLAAIALAVRLSSPGPVLFRQVRVGRDGRRFALLKFRSMREAPLETAPPTAAAPADAGLAPGGVEGADRRTRVGSLLRRTSLDELPQLLNVLRGEMSIVGPRPERPEFVERFDRLVDRYEDRHRVKSGITGWAQVNGLRGKTPIEDRVEWDNWYIQNWSLWLDFKILVRTAGAVLRGAE